MPSKPKRPDVDAAVLRSLLRLTEGDPSSFTAATGPPPEITAYIRRAPPAEIRGLLIAALRQWHTTRKQ